MTEEQKRLYDGNTFIAAQKKTGVKWLSDDIRKLAKSSLAVAQQYAADYGYVRGVKQEIGGTAGFAQAAKPESKYLLELLDALTHSSRRKMGAVKLHPLDSANSVAAMKKIAAAAQKRKLKSEAAEEARLRRERAAAAEAQQRVKIKLATDFMAAGNFTGAMRACREAIECNPECSRVHYLMFLADNNIKSVQQFKSGTNTHVYHFEQFYEAMNYASDEEAGEYLSDLAERVKNFDEIKVLKEYMNLAAQYDVEDEERQIVANVYDRIMCDRYGSSDTAMQYFDVITQNMSPDSDTYLDYNLAFGDKVLAKNPIAAQKYYANALEYCTLVGASGNVENTTQYKLYLAQSGASNTAALLKKVGDFKQMDATVFGNGCNEYAVTEICEQCLSSSGSDLLTAEPLFEYAIDKLPKTKSKTAIKYLCAYTEQLISFGYFDQAQKHNERALSLNKDCHEAHFNRMLISKKIVNPLELVDYASNIFDDTDFYAATSAYALLNKEGNIYINIGDALVRADKKLKDPKCRRQVLRLCKLKRSELAKCDTKIDPYVTEFNNQEAARKRRERERAERERQDRERREREARAAVARKKGMKKASGNCFLLAIPAMILGAVMLLAYFKPLAVFQFIHFGWLVGITVVVCLTMFIITCVYYSNGYYVDYLNAKGFRGFLTAAGYLVCFALMITVVVQPKEISITNARELQAIANLNPDIVYNYELQNDIDLSEIKSFKPIPKLNEKCTFNGNGHTIKNMHITKMRKITIKLNPYYAGVDTSKRYSAAFIAYNSGVIKDVTFKDCTVQIENIDSYDEQRRKNGIFKDIVYGYSDGGYTSNVKTENCVVEK